MNDPEVEFYPDADGKWRWRLKAANGEIVLPPEQHDSIADALRAYQTAVKLLPEAAIEIRNEA